MPPINILHIMSKLPVGGVENQLLTVLGKYDKKKFSPAVCSLLDKGEIGREIEGLGIPVVCLNKLRHRFDWSIVRDITHLIREKDIRIVRTHQYHANLYGRLAAKMMKVPCIVASVHNVYTMDKKFHKRIINNYLARFTDRIIAVSGAVKKDIVKYDCIDENKVAVIHNGVDINKFSVDRSTEIRAELGIPAGYPVLGTVGRLTVQKGHKYLLKAVSQLIAQFPQIRLVIIGDGPLRPELESYATTLGIDKNVDFLGTRRDIPELLAAIDIFVLPSLWEGLVNALIEAMGAGKPVITTDIPPIKEIVDSDKVGILVPPENSDAIASALTLLLKDRPLADSLGKAAKKKVAESFSIEDTLRKYEALFEEILRGKNWNI